MMGNRSKHNIRLAVPFFGVADMEASLHFYVDGLGFTMTKQWIPRGKIEWCWLERDAVSLMLQSPPADKPAPPEPPPSPEQAPSPEVAPPPKPPPPSPKTGPSICFQCEDALALYQEYKARGLPVSEPFVGNGMWVVMLKDPDGYKLEFESLTDVAEEMTYTAWREGMLKSEKESK
jgi:lactoylglutathione lyase